MRKKEGSSAERRSVSHNGMGMSTHASSTTQYSLFGVRIIHAFLVETLLIFRQGEIIKVLSAACIPIALICEHIPGVEPAMSSYHMVWNPILLNLLDQKLPGHAEKF